MKLNTLIKRYERKTNKSKLKWQEVRHIAALIKMKHYLEDHGNKPDISFLIQDDNTWIETSATNDEHPALMYEIFRSALAKTVDQILTDLGVLKK